MNNYFGYLYQGEGITGGSDVGAMTEALYSCTAIVFINRGKARHGIYHYGMGEIENLHVVSTIRSMILDVQPTEIHVTPSSSELAGGEGSAGHQAIVEDLHALADLLKYHAQIERIHRQPANDFGSIVYRNNEYHINAPPGDDDVVQDIPFNYRRKFNTWGRPLAGTNQGYYYGAYGDIRRNFPGYGWLENAVPSAVPEPQPSAGPAAPRLSRLRRFQARMSSIKRIGRK